MPVTVRVPSPLRNLTDGTAEVQIEAANVREAVAGLEAAYPGFEERLLDDDGDLRRFVNVFVRDEDVRFQDGLDTALTDGDTVSIVPAVAGGAGPCFPRSRQERGAATSNDGATTARTRRPTRRAALKVGTSRADADNVTNRT